MNTSIHRLFTQKPKRFEWNAERDETLKRMREQGHSARAIGEELGVTRSAILGRAHRLGLSRPTQSSVTRKKNEANPLILNRRPHFEDRQEPRGCRWIDGDPMQEGWEFCQREQAEGSSYCGYHYHQAVDHDATKRARGKRRKWRVRAA